MPQHKCVGHSFNYKARCMHRMAHAALTVLSLHTFTCCCAGAQACSCITASFSKSRPSAPTAAGYAEWRPGAIYTDFHLLAKKPRNYRVVNTSVIMGAENLYFWLLTFVKKSFKNGFYSAKLLGKQPAVLYITHSTIPRSLGESLVKCIVT